MKTDSGLASRFNATRSEDYKLPVFIYPLVQWWDKHFQKSRGRPISIDLDWLDQTFLERQKFLYDTFGQFGIGQVSPQLDRQYLSTVMPYWYFLVPVLLGTKLSLREIGGYGWQNMELEKVKRIEPVDIRKTPLADSILRQRDFMIDRYGTVAQMLDVESVTNNAFVLRGTEFYSDLLVEKDLVHHYFKVIYETMSHLYRFTIEEFGPMDVFSLCNCNCALISPSLYAEMILKYDIQMVDFVLEASESAPQIRIHHCSVKTEPFAEAYSEIPKLRILQGSHDSDLEVIHRHLPNVAFSSLLPPVDLQNKTESQIINELDQCIAGGTHDLAIMSIDPSYGPNNIVKLLARIQEIASNYAREPEFYIYPLTREEVGWQFRQYGRELEASTPFSSIVIS